MESEGVETPLGALGREKATTEPARQLEAVLANIAEGVNIVDAEGRVVLVNEGFMRLYGFPPHLAAPGTPIAAFVRHRLGEEAAALAEGYDVEAVVAERVQELLDAGSGELKETLPDGRVVWIRRQRLPDGLLVSTYGDVTEQKRHEEWLALLATAVEQEGDSVELADAEYRLLFVNPAFTALTGYRREEALGRTPAELVRSDQHDDAFFAEMRETLQRGEVWQGRLISRHKEGRLLYQDATISPVRDAEGRITHYVAVKRDVGEQVCAAEALRASEERFRSMVEDQTEFIARVTPELTLTFVNSALCRHLGKSRTELIGTSVLDLMTEAQRERYLANIGQLSPDGPTVSDQYEMVRADGQICWEQWTDRAFFDSDGGIVGYQAVGRDITREKRAEQAIRETEERLRTIAEGVPLPMVIAGLAEPEALFVNEPAREVFGLEVGDTGRTLVKHWEQPERRAQMIEQLTRGCCVDGFEAQLRRADGTPFFALISARPTVFEGRTAMLNVCMDITERRQMERALRESEARLAAFMDNAPVGMHVKDLEGRYVLLNPVTCRLLGAGPKEMLGRTIADSRTRLDLQAVAERDQEVARTGRVRVFERHTPDQDFHTWDLAIRFPIRDLDGNVTHIGGFDLDISERKAMEVALKASEQRFRTIAEAHPVPMIIARLSDHRPLFVSTSFRELFQLGEMELPLRGIANLYVDPGDREEGFREVQKHGWLDGYELTLRRTDGTAFPASLTSRLMEYEGEPAVVTSFTDLTDKKLAEAEVARHRDALNQSEKISALGTLLAGVAHELNNPLSVVVGQSAFLEDTAPDEVTRGRAGKIRGAADRCARIVRTFLTMARSRPMARGPVDLNATVEAALELLAYGLRTADIKLLRDLSPDLPTLWGEGDQLHQVLTNLIINAQQAMQEIESPRELRITTRREGSMVRVDVTDNGPGIDPQLAKRVFEPFFTTKPGGVGTGIGLSVCHGIIRGHEGSIELSSIPGKGASFVIRLPLASEHQRSSADEAEGPE